MLPVGRVLLVRHVSTLECDWLSRRKEKTSVPEEEVCQFSFAWKMSEKSLISSLSSYFLNCCFYFLLSGLTVLFYFHFKKSVFFNSTFSALHCFFYIAFLIVGCWCTSMFQGNKLNKYILIALLPSTWLFKTCF